MEMLLNIKEASQSVVSTRRPWRVFLDVSAMSFPSSISEATTRISHNLTYFLFNYAIFFVVVFLLSLLRNPLSLLIFLLLSAAWYFLYFSRDDLPVALIPLVFLTLIALFATATWLNLFLALLIASLVICLHAALRTTDELVGDDPYAPMLADSPTAAAAYVPV